MAKKRYRTPVTDSERLQEARDAIRRLQDTLNVGDNRFGDYGRNVRDNIARWEKTIAEIEGKRS